MQLTRYADAATFLDAAATFLEAHEAEHCLLLGIAQTLKLRTEPPRTRPYLALVMEGEDVLAAAVQTPPHNVVLSLSGAPEAFAVFVEDLRGRNEPVPGVIGPTASSRAFAELWQAATGQPFQRERAERIYRLEQVNAIIGVPGRMRRAAEADRTLLKEWILAFDREALNAPAPDSDEDLNRAVDRYLTEHNMGMYLWEAGGAPVAMAGHSGPTPHGMRVGPVYTPPELRGRGYASALVAALSQTLLDHGRQFCFLFTDLANPTSNHIYQTIGYEPVCDVDVYRFAQG